ncbi:MAG: F0F1 ATP synthase subunit B [Gammaproteobacteria bacterium]
MKNANCYRATFGAFALALSATANAAEGEFKLLSVTTLLGQIITFAVLVWFMMKFVWPPLMTKIDDRRKQIADGLAAAERGKKDLADAAAEKTSIIKEARADASRIVADGKEQKTAVIAQARSEAETERARIVEQGRREVESEKAAMRRELQKKLGGLAVAGAKRILEREVDPKAHADIIDSLREKI